MLKAGDRAPEIDAETTNGDRFVLSKSTKHCTVVYFFPKAFTPGCTKETKLFTDNHQELSLGGADIIGISTDDNKTQCEFATSMAAPFPLIADADKSISRAFGVLWPVLGVPHRVTFIVDPSMHILAVFQHELDIEKHRNDVLLFVDELFRARAVLRETKTRPPPSE